MNTELDLQQIFYIIRHKLWLILLSTAAFGVCALLISQLLITPLYTTVASMYVYSEGVRANNAITSTELNTSQKLVQTYIVILTSNSVLDQVAEKLENEYSAKELRKMITASAIGETEAFQVSVTHPDPAMAQKIANTVANVAPDEIIRVVKAGAVEVIDYATLPLAPSSPRTTTNTAIGALLGMMVSVLFVIVKAMLDTAVRCEEDITENFNIPVLGVIPSLSSTEKEEGHNHVAS